MLAALDELKIVALRGLIRAFTGEDPVVTSGTDNLGEFKTVSLTPTQKTLLQSELKKQMQKAPGRVRIDVSGVLTPLIISKGTPWLTGSAIAGFFIGRISKR